MDGCNLCASAALTIACHAKFFARECCTGTMQCASYTSTRRLSPAAQTHAVEFDLRHAPASTICSGFYPTGVCSREPWWSAWRALATVAPKTADCVIITFARHGRSPEVNVMRDDTADWTNWQWGNAGIRGRRGEVSGMVPRFCNGTLGSIAFMRLFCWPAGPSFIPLEPSSLARRSGE